MYKILDCKYNLRLTLDLLIFQTLIIDYIRYMFYEATDAQYINCGESRSKLELCRGCIVLYSIV